jgi:hypothetical protein
MADELRVRRRRAVDRQAGVGRHRGRRRASAVLACLSHRLGPGPANHRSLSALLAQPGLQRTRRARGAPAPSCSCGIYATRQSQHALPYLSRFFRLAPRGLHRVVGRVPLRGSVVEASRGFRASCAYPDRLFVTTGRRRLRSWLSGLPPPTLAAEEIALALAYYGGPVELADCATGKSSRRSSSRRQRRSPPETRSTWARSSARVARSKSRPQAHRCRNPPSRSFSGRRLPLLNSSVPAGALRSPHEAEGA